MKMEVFALVLTADFCRYIIDVLIENFNTTERISLGMDQSGSGMDNKYEALFNPVNPVSLTGSQKAFASKVIDRPHVGGLRRLAGTLSKLSLVAEVGCRIHLALIDMLNTYPMMVTQAFDHIDKEDVIFMSKDISSKTEEVIRSVLADITPSFTPTRILWSAT